jgi:hypothetical protein
MSQSSDDDASVPEKVYRTVSPPYRGRADSEMGTIGLIYFLGLLILLIPLLPFLAIVWLVSRLLGRN